MFPLPRELGSLIYPTTPQITWKLFTQIIRLDVRGNILNKTQRQAQVYQMDDWNGQGYSPHGHQLCRLVTDTVDPVEDDMFPCLQS